MSNAQDQEDQEEQRKFVADAAARGLSLVELMKELDKNADLRDRVNRGLYPEIFSTRQTEPELPQSECPVMQAAYRGINQINGYLGYREPLYSSEWTKAPSTPELQHERATICVRWFCAQVLSITEKSNVQPPASDVALACRPLLEAMGTAGTPHRLVEATFESTLAILNAYGSECARRGEKLSTVSLLMGSCLFHLTQQLFRSPTPQVPPCPELTMSERGEENEQ